MIDKAYKNYFLELNSLDTQSKKINEISQRINDFKIYSINASKLGNSSFLNEKSNFLNLNINYKNFENELDDLFNRIINDKYFDNEEYELATRKLDELFNIAGNLNSIRENFQIVLNSNFIIHAFDDKSRKYFIKGLNDELNHVFSQKKMNVNAQKIPAQLRHINKELIDIDELIKESNEYSISVLDRALLDKDLDFKSLFKKGNFINHQIQKIVQGKFEFIENDVSNRPLYNMFKMLADDVCYSLVEEISKQSMSNEYKKHNNIAHKLINNYFRGLTKGDNFDIEFIKNKVKEIYENVKSNNIAAYNKLMEEKRKAKLQKKILKYVSYIVGGLLALWAIIALIGFLWTNYPGWTFIVGVLIIYGIYKVGTSK